MAEKFNTPRGTVEAVPTGPGQWGAFLLGGEGFLGAIELDSPEGGYTAFPVGRNPKSHSSLRAAVEFLGGA